MHHPRGIRERWRNLKANAALELVNGNARRA